MFYVIVVHVCLFAHTYFHVRRIPKRSRVARKKREPHSPQRHMTLRVRERAAERKKKVQMLVNKQFAD